MKISIQKIMQKATEEALNNVKIDNIPFREWIDNINNAYENKKCDLNTCRYNADGKELATYKGKIDLSTNDGGYVKFDFKGKRYIYYNCFVESVADID